MDPDHRARDRGYPLKSFNLPLMVLVCTNRAEMNCVSRESTENVIRYNNDNGNRPISNTIHCFCRCMRTSHCGKLVDAQKKKKKKHDLFLVKFC